MRALFKSVCTLGIGTYGFVTNRLYSACAFISFKGLWITHEFRGVDCKALARTVASPYIKAAGWFVSSLSSSLVLVVIGRRLVGRFHCHLAITNL